MDKRQSHVDFWESLSDEAKAGIERGLEDVDAGRVYTHEEVMEAMKAKFNLEFANKAL